MCLRAAVRCVSGGVGGNGLEFNPIMTPDNAFEILCPSANLDLMGGRVRWGGGGVR